MRYAAMLVLVTAPLADILIQQVSNPSVRDWGTHAKSREITDRFYHRRLCQGGRLEVEGAGSIIAARALGAPSVARR